MPTSRALLFLTLATALPAQGCPDIEATERAAQQPVDMSYDACSARARYPLRALREQLSGEVVLDVVVSAAGKAQSVAVVSAQPPGIFEESALRWARASCYEVRTLAGTPTCYRDRVPVNFEFRGSD